MHISVFHFLSNDDFFCNFFFFSGNAKRESDKTIFTNCRWYQCWSHFERRHLHLVSPTGAWISPYKFKFRQQYRLNLKVSAFGEISCVTLNLNDVNLTSAFLWTAAGAKDLNIKEEAVSRGRFGRSYCIDPCQMALLKFLIESCWNIYTNKRMYSKQPLQWKCTAFLRSLSTCIYSLYKAAI